MCGTAERTDVPAGPGRRPAQQQGRTGGYRLLYTGVHGALQSVTGHPGLGIADITDLVAATNIPGHGSDMKEVNMHGYTVNFVGIQYMGNQILAWAPCCS